MPAINPNKKNKTKINIIDYDTNQFKEKALKKISECYAFKDTPTVTWLDIEAGQETDIQKLGEVYGFHHLILEDITQKERPKMEDMGGYIYVTLRMLYPFNGCGRVVSEQISLILGKNYVISLQEGLEGDIFDPIRDRLRKNKGRSRKMGADYLLYHLMDTIVDGYFEVVEQIGNAIDVLEEKLISSPRPRNLKQINNLKKNINVLRRSVWPARELINRLERSESNLVKNETLIYLRDVYDHTIQLIETIETYRDMLSGMMDIYLSSTSNKMNEVMKVLTVIATIFMPLTFIAGIYGMNFHFMPELEWHWGYPMAMLIMAGIGLVMFFYFRKKEWI